MSPNSEQRRLLTILFADLSGFTSFAQHLDPEEIREALDICLTQLNRIITKHGGTIHKYEGDLIIAIFGLPQMHEDDPERAIRASLEMVASIPEINKILSSKLKATWDLGIHAGISMGTVFVGEIGSVEKKEYTIIGEEVNLASRLKDAAQRGEIMVSSRIFRLTRYLFDYQALQPIALKGFDKSFEVYRPLKIKEKPDAKRGIQGLYSSLVGRDRELGLISEKITDLLSNHNGGMIYVFGEAGLGKTRLFQEVKNLIDKQERRVMILEGHCLSYGEKLAYYPFITILSQYFETHENDPPEVVEKKLSKKITNLIPEKYKEIIPFIGQLFSIPLASEFEERTKYLDGPNLKLQTSIALRNLFISVSRKNPLLLVIEDHHWIDSSSLSFLEFIAEATMSAPVLIIVLSRPEKETEGWQVKERNRKKLMNCFTEINLHPLDANASVQLTNNLLKISELSDMDRDRIISKSEGNPFYLEEIFRSLIDRGFLEYRSGRWQLTRPLSMPDIPDTIQEVIATRIDRLNPEDKDILLKAAVIGRSFYVKILERLANIDSLIMSLHLATLEEFEYIMSLAKEPELEYAFKHPLMQEVAYNSLLKKHRTGLHKQIAEIIIAAFGSRLEEFTDIIAHHYDQSDNTEQAIEWLKKAGTRALKQNALEEAMRYFQRLVSVIEQMAEKPADQTDSLREAHEMLGNIHNLQGRYKEAVNEYELMLKTARELIARSTAQRRIAGVYISQGKYDEALALLKAAEEPLNSDSTAAVIERAEIKCLRSNIYQITRSMDASIKEIRSALALIEPLESDRHVNDLTARCLVHLANAQRTGGEFDMAIETFKKSIRILKELDNKFNMVTAMANLGIVYFRKGSIKEGESLFQEALHISEGLGFKRTTSMVYANFGIYYASIGEHEKAEEFYRKNLTISEEIGEKRQLSLAYNNLGKVCLAKHDYEQARKHFDTSIKIATEIGETAVIGAVYGNMAILFTRLNDYDRALEYLFKTEQIFTSSGNKEMLVATYYHLAETYLAQRISLGRALEYAQKGLALATAIGLKSGQADCHFVHAKICAVTGELAQAEEEIKIAEKLFFETTRKADLIYLYSDYAEILKTAGQQELAETYLAKARQIEMDLASIKQTP